MRRRATPEPAPDGPPVELLRFRPAEWLDEDDPPRRPGEEWPDAGTIRALRRWLDAKHEWRARYGEWPAAPTRQPATR